MAVSKYITKVAIVGATGHSGSFITNALLKNGKHTITAITRSSKNTFPSGVTPKEVDYDNHASIVEALKGQDALIITMGSMAPKDMQSRLIAAAAEADVKWILPNEWSPDSDHDGFAKDVPMFTSKMDARKEIQDRGLNYLAVATGFWYEWSLAFADGYGFDFANKKVTFVDDGETKISTSTWPQIGRAVVALLSLPINAPNDSVNPESTLSNLANKMIYINSFTLSQKDMFASILRVTGDKESDWEISYEPAEERYSAGVKQMQGGDRSGFIKLMYTRGFYKDGVGNFESAKGTANRLLGLDVEKEDGLDEATKRGITRAANPFGAA